MPLAQKDLAVVLDDLDEGLTNSSKVAATLHDDFLVYLIDIAIIHVRRTAVGIFDNPKRVSTRGAERHHAAVSEFMETQIHDLRKILAGRGKNAVPLFGDGGNRPTVSCEQFC
jgi:hypothetical protein